MIKKYIKKPKKPIEIEAIQLTEDNIIEVFDFLVGKKYKNFKSKEEKEKFISKKKKEGNIGIVTPEGPEIVDFGDYIIKDPYGEFYRVKKDLFQQTYEEVK